MIALALTVALSTPTPDWRKGIDPELLAQNDSDATEIVQKIANEGKQEFKPWGLVTGLALMLAGEYLIPGPKPVPNGPMFARVSSLGRLQYGWPSPVSVLGVFVFTFSLAHGRADETRTDNEVRKP